MKHLLIIFSVLFTLSCQTNENDANSLDHFEFPPEWEPHQAIWIDIHEYWSPFSLNAQIATRLEIVKALHKNVEVKILTTSDSLASTLVNMMIEMDIDTSKTKLIINPLPNNYMRDTGPIFLSNGKSLRMANWNWKCLNSFCDEKSDLRGTIDDSLANQFHYPIQSSPVNYEGGAIVVNNQSALSIKDYALEQNEEQLSIEEIEEAIKNLYGKEQVIWLEGIPILERNGLKIDNYFGQGADGHIDALVRFANDSTLFVTTISDEDKDKSPIQRHDYEIYQGYLRQLREAKRVNGKPFHLVEIPSPDISLHLGKIPASVIWEVLRVYEIDDRFEKSDIINMVPVIGYANYLLSNGVVLVAQYWEEGLPESEKEKDKTMVDILKRHFPDREIIGITAKGINWDGGGIHCSTQQEPMVNKK